MRKTLLRMQGGITERAPRRKVLIRARMRAGGPPVDICIRDISSRGMLVQTHAPPPRGTFIEIVRPGLPIVGQVIWRSERRFGVATREIINVPAFISEGNEPMSTAAIVALSTSSIHHGLRLAPMGAAEVAERSRRWAAAGQFAFAVTLVTTAALVMAVALHHVLAPTLQSISEHLQR